MHTKNLMGYNLKVNVQSQISACTDLAPFVKILIKTSNSANTISSKKFMKCKLSEFSKLSDSYTV